MLMPQARDAHRHPSESHAERTRHPTSLRPSLLSRNRETLLTSRAKFAPNTKDISQTWYYFDIPQINVPCADPLRVQAEITVAESPSPNAVGSRIVMPTRKIEPCPMVLSTAIDAL